MKDERTGVAMTKLWRTYAWKDNEDEQVDFVAQELRKVGLAASQSSLQAAAPHPS